MIIMLKISFLITIYIFIYEHSLNFNSFCVIFSIIAFFLFSLHTAMHLLEVSKALLCGCSIHQLFVFLIVRAIEHQKIFLR